MSAKPTGAYSMLQEMYLTICCITAWKMEIHGFPVKLIHPSGRNGSIIQAKMQRSKHCHKLMDTYYNSVGRNATLLLNFPIMPNGLIHENDEKAALEFGKMIKETFSVNLAKKTKAEASNVRGGASKFSASKASRWRHRNILGCR